MMQYFNSTESKINNSASITNESYPVAITTESISTDPVTLISAKISWRAVLFLVWIVIASMLGLVLFKRTVFIRRLVIKSLGIDFPDNKSISPEDVLKRCSLCFGLKKQIPLKISPYATSPVVCGLLRPIILLPQNLISSLNPGQLRAIFFHELAHIKRYDLWINLLQMLLQIIYFYNPLLWIANSRIRRTREQAVDEMVLVAMGKDAGEYPETLVNVAKLAFKRPALSLRLIGVVESEDALLGRIKHILNRPLPKSAKLGIVGLIVILIAAVILLPMAKNNKFSNWFGRNALIKFRPLESTTKYPNAYTKNYIVSFRKGEKLAIIVELFQTGKPMRNLGCKIFSGSLEPEELLVVLNKNYLNEEQTDIKYDLRISLGEQVFKLNDILVHTPAWFNGKNLDFFSGSSIPPAKLSKGQKYIEFANLISERAFPDDRRDDSPRIWIPGYVTDIPGQMYCILVKMLPLSQLEKLDVAVSVIDEKIQLPDGTYLPPNSSREERKSIADDYLLKVKEDLLRSEMPLPKLVAHQYYKAGESIAIIAEQVNSGQWKPTLGDLDLRNMDEELCFFSIDGKEFDSSLIFGPFEAFGANLHIPGDLGIRDLQLPLGEHTAAFGWRNIFAINLDEPDKNLFYKRLLTYPVEFEVVEEIPDGYYSKVYEEGWEDILASNISTPFTDDTMRQGVAGVLLTLCVNPLPFEIAFDVYAQAEGSERKEYVGQIARQANLKSRYILSCGSRIESLDWDNVGQKRYRLILVPSEKAAIANPPVTHYYGKEYVTDWVTFEKSKMFEQHYKSFFMDRIDHFSIIQNENGFKKYCMGIKAENPIARPKTIIKEFSFFLLKFLKAILK